MPRGDQAMAWVNEAKSERADIILADGTKLQGVLNQNLNRLLRPCPFTAVAAGAQSGGVSFQQMGSIGKNVQYLRVQREAFIASSPGRPLPPACPVQLTLVCGASVKLGQSAQVPHQDMHMHPCACACACICFHLPVCIHMRPHMRMHEGRMNT